MNTKPNKDTPLVFRPSNLLGIAICQPLHLVGVIAYSSMQLIHMHES